MKSGFFGKAGLLDPTTRAITRSSTLPKKSNFTAAKSNFWGQARLAYQKFNFFGKVELHGQDLHKKKLCSIIVRSKFRLATLTIEQVTGLA